MHRFYGGLSGSTAASAFFPIYERLIVSDAEIDLIVVNELRRGGKTKLGQGFVYLYYTKCIAFTSARACSRRRVFSVRPRRLLSPRYDNAVNWNHFDNAGERIVKFPKCHSLRCDKVLTCEGNKFKIEMTQVAGRAWNKVKGVDQAEIIETGLI